MIEFLTIALSFPTIIFTTLLGVMLVYWSLVIFGALDLEALDSGVEGAADGVLEGATDGVLEGAADGAMDGVSDGALDGAMDGTESVVHSVGSAAALLAFLRFGKVPVTVILSLLVIWSWLFSYIGTVFLARGGLSDVIHGLAAIALGLGGVAVSIPLTSISIRPLEGLFEIHTKRGQETLVGKSCRVTSLRVDGKFGTALYDDGGGGLILYVRCRRDNSLTKGQEALIVGYESTSRTYQVEPLSSEKELLTARVAQRTKEQDLG